MPTRAQKKAACAKWRVFWSPEASAKARMAGRAFIASACAKEHPHPKMTSRGVAYFSLEFDRGLKYDWVHRWIRKCVRVKAALWKLVPLLPADEGGSAASAEGAAELVESAPSSLVAASAAASPSATPSTTAQLLALKLVTQMGSNSLQGSPWKKRLEHKPLCRNRPDYNILQHGGILVVLFFLHGLPPKYEGIWALQHHALLNHQVPTE